MPSCSYGHLSNLCRRLKHLRTRADFKRYVEGDEFGAALAAIEGKDRLKALAAIGRAWAWYDRAAPIPPALSMRVSWTEERKAQLRRVAARCNYDRTEIARQMGIPLPAIRTAVWKYARPPESSLQHP